MTNLTMTKDLFSTDSSSDDLFDTRSFKTDEPIQLNLPDADVRLYKHFFSADEADALFETLKQEINWQQEKVKVYGKLHNTPRLTAWYGEPNKTYTYSGLSATTTPWTNSLLSVKHKLESICEHTLNSVLLNLYRDGSDGVSWHSDDEIELGKNPLIASVSLGETRPFQMKPKLLKKDSSLKKDRVDIPLAHGDLLVMQGETQHNWLHQIPKSKKALRERINLTFRFVS